MSEIEKESFLKASIKTEAGAEAISRLCEGLSKLAEATKPIQDKTDGVPVVYRSVCDTIKNLVKFIDSSIPRE